MKRGIIAIIMAAAMSLYAAEPQPIWKQWEESKEYQEYTRLGGEGSSSAEKLESEFEQKLIDKILADFIASYPDTYNKEKLKKLIEDLGYSKRYMLADIYTQIKPLLNLSHTPKEYGQISSNIYFYAKSISEYNGMAVSNLQKLVLKVPEINNTKVHGYLLDQAKRHDKASAIDKDIPSTIAECEAMIQKHKEHIVELKKGNYTKAIKHFEKAVSYYQNVITRLHAGNINDAKSSYFIAKTVEETALWSEISDKLKNL